MTNSYLFLICVFLFGAMAQAIFLIQHKQSLGRTLFLLVSSGLGFFTIALFNSMDPRLVLPGAVLWFVYFIVSFPLVLKLDALPVISRRSLVGLTVIFWYVYLTGFARNPVFNAPALVACVFSAGVLVISLGDWPLHAFWRFFCYAWFLLVIISLAVYHFNLGTIKYFFVPGGAPPQALAVLLAGMAMFYIAMHLWYAVQTLPTQLLNRSKSTAYALWEWEIHRKIFSYKYHHEPIVVPLDAVIIAVVFILLLWLNRHLSLLADQVLVDLLILWTVTWSPRTRWAYQ